MGSHLHGTVLALCGLVASLALARGASLPPAALLEGPATDHGDTRAPGQGLDGLLGSLLGPDDASSAHVQSTPTLSRAVRAAGSPTYTQDGAGKTYDGMATLCAARGASLCNVAQVCPNGGAHSAPAGGTQDFDDMWVPVVDTTRAGGKQWVQVGRRAGGTCKRLTDFHAANTAGSWMETTVDKPWKRVTACCGGESATPTTSADSPTCAVSSAEAAWRMWGTHTCTQMQDNWGVCTNKNDVNHATVMRSCPATCSCAIATANGMPGDAFTLIFVSDIEEGYRAHTTQDVKDIMAEIADLKSGARQESFGGEFAGVPVTPKLVVHGGDSYDNIDGGEKARSRKTAATEMYHAGIPYITTDGNHDDNAGSYVTTANVWSSYTAAKDPSMTFAYKNVPGAGGYTATFNGLQIASFLHSADGPSKAQLKAMAGALDTNKPAVVVNHRPDGGVDDWVKTMPRGTAVFSGHTHRSNTRALDAGHMAYTAPYPHQWNNLAYGKASIKRERGMLAVLVSPTEGVLDVKQLDTRLRSRTWSDGHLCGMGTTCSKCKNGHEYWYTKVMTACGPEPKFSDGTRCLAGTSCNLCASGKYEWWDSKVGHHCGSEPCWGRGTVCGLGTTEKNCCRGASCPWYQFGVCTCK